MSVRVYLVGAGPGDPELLTLGAKRVIERAEVILYDGLINEQILAFASASCERICVGKRGNGGAWTQPQIDDLIVKVAREGRRVVRLKGGDTAVFARTAEEVERLEAEGIAYRIVPGLTAALAVSAYTGIPLTHRDWSSGVAILAAQLQNHDGESEAEDQLDWEALARFPGTLVLYMAIGSASSWSKKLIASGKPMSTPVALVRRCSWPDQEVLECELRSVSETLGLNPQFTAPVICIIGPVVRLKSKAASPLPLNPITVIVSSPEAQAHRLADMLRPLGVSVWVRPAMLIEGAGPGGIDGAIDELERTDWIVFSSRYGVKYFMERLFERGGDSRAFGKVRIASVGRATDEALREFGLRSDWTPKLDQGAEALLLDWLPEVRGSRVLLVRTAEGSEILRDRLVSSVSKLHSVDIYKQCPVLGWQDMDAIRAKIVVGYQSGRRVWMTATSSNLARATWGLLGRESGLVRWLAISPGVAEVLRGLGCDQENILVAQQATYESMCRAIAVAESIG
ncbi:MAG: uroporphyrinogen-III C-methyltransferase [Planctomycetota bacterium]|nr:uroporphyrinogen-III C-methyltransferase [Planctomycetota bacterium]